MYFLLLRTPQGIWVDQNGDQVDFFNWKRWKQWPISKLPSDTVVWMKNDGTWDTLTGWRSQQYKYRKPNKGTARKRIICEQEIICK